MYKYPERLGTYHSLSFQVPSAFVQYTLLSECFVDVCREIFLGAQYSGFVPSEFEGNPPVTVSKTSSNTVRRYVASYPNPVPRSQQKRGIHFPTIEMWSLSAVQKSPTSISLFFDPTYGYQGENDSLIQEPFLNPFEILLDFDPSSHQVNLTFNPQPHLMGRGRLKAGYLLTPPSELSQVFSSYAIGLLSQSANDDPDDSSRVTITLNPDGSFASSDNPRVSATVLDTSKVTNPESDFDPVPTMFIGYISRVVAISSLPKDLDHDSRRFEISGLNLYPSPHEVKLTHKEKNKLSLLKGIARVLVDFRQDNPLSPVEVPFIRTTKPRFVIPSATRVGAIDTTIDYVTSGFPKHMFASRFTSATSAQTWLDNYDYRVSGHIPAMVVTATYPVSYIDLSSLAVTYPEYNQLVAYLLRNPEDTELNHLLLRADAGITTPAKVKWDELSPAERKNLFEQESPVRPEYADLRVSSLAKFRIPEDGREFEVAFDTTSGELYSEYSVLESQRYLLFEKLRHALVPHDYLPDFVTRSEVEELLSAIRSDPDPSTFDGGQRELDSALETIDKYFATSRQCDRALNSYSNHEKGYTGWERYYAVPNGHIHSSTYCSSLNKGRTATTLVFLADVSALPMESAVKYYGATLCTFCFPDAPVEFTTDTVGGKPLPTPCPGSGEFMTWAKLGILRGECSYCGQRVRVASSQSLYLRKHNLPED